MRQCLFWSVAQQAMFDKKKMRSCSPAQSFASKRKIWVNLRLYKTPDFLCQNLDIWSSIFQSFAKKISFVRECEKVLNSLLKIYFVVLVERPVFCRYHKLKHYCSYFKCQMKQFQILKNIEFPKNLRKKINKTPGYIRDIFPFQNYLGNVKMP